MENQTWYEEEELPVDPIAVEELEAICLDTKEQDKKIKEMEAAVKKEKAILTTMKNKIMAHFEKLGKSKYVSEHGTFYTRTEFSVTTPKTEDEKKAFFKWCEDKEIFWEYVSVNSRSLQSLYKSCLESEGEDFSMPGVPEPKVFEKLAIRSK